jgi:hypothetical protein
MSNTRIALTVILAAALTVPPGLARAAPPGRLNLPVRITADLLPFLRVQDNCGRECGGSDNDKGYTDQGDDPPELSATGAQRIEWLIADRIRHCEQYRPIWRIDCLADGFKQIARTLPRGAGYASIRMELSSAADELAALARRNADPQKPPERLRAQTSNGPRRTSRPIVAVAPQNLPAANRAAEAIVADLSTTLLRSAPGSGAQPEIERIAAAVDSTRILLRSS